jgi:hypothetical protein
MMDNEDSIKLGKDDLVEPSNITDSFTEYEQN